MCCNLCCVAHVCELEQAPAIGRSIRLDSPAFQIFPRLSHLVVVMSDFPDFLAAAGLDLVSHYLSHYLSVGPYRIDACVGVGEVAAGEPTPGDSAGIEPGTPDVPSCGVPVFDPVCFQDTAVQTETEIFIMNFVAGSFLEVLTASVKALSPEDIAKRLQRTVRTPTWRLLVWGWHSLLRRRPCLRLRRLQPRCR